ncbi:unnamed protein product, partial [Didymodactylos carnosus]
MFVNNDTNTSSIPNKLSFISQIKSHFVKHHKKALSVSSINNNSSELPSSEDYTLEDNLNRLHDNEITIRSSKQSIQKTDLWDI